MKKSLLLSIVLLGMIATPSSALEQDSEGFYLISTASDLVDFAKMVNNQSGATTFNARLTADIDLKGLDWEPIGFQGSNGQHPYIGTFDGQEHFICNMTINNNEGHQGFFGSVDGKVVLKNFVVTGSVNCKDQSGGIVGYLPNDGANLIFENVGNECDVTCTGYGCGGLFGYTWRNGSVTMKNCFNTGNISGNTSENGTNGKAGALIGSTNTDIVVENCYNTGSVSGVSTAASGDMNYMFFSNKDGASVTASNLYDSYIDEYLYSTITDESAKSGELCFNLNNFQSGDDVVWRQNLGKDTHPYPFKSRELVYINNNGKYYTTGINTIEGEKTGALGYYSTSAVRQSKPARGLNIVKMADGKVNKVLMR